MTQTNPVLDFIAVDESKLPRLLDTPLERYLNKDVC